MDKNDDILIMDPDNGDDYFVQPTDDEKLFAALIYITSFFTTIIGPLVIWLIKRDESKFIDHHGKEYLNFIISYFIYSVVAWVSVIILIGFILGPIVTIAALVFTIIAIVKAFKGEMYRIPFIIRFIK